jgi:MOSC domain-containing protein YiiM
VAGGWLEAIYLASERGGPPVSVTSAEAVAGSGLLGDRYAAGTGTYWRPSKPGQDLTLIEAEAVERVATERGVAITAGATRRNLVTRGLRLDALRGHRFRIGSVECIGVRDCPPCRYLESLTVPGVARALWGAGGLRADVVAGGVIGVGDPIVLLP